MMDDLYTEIVNYHKMSFDREQLISDYAQSIVEGWDLDILLGFAYDKIVENLDKYSDKNLIEEITEFSPDLLEGVEVPDA
jgi:hypothetical protein